jgi:O-methyltransferase involved in polyketide biosynthesis
VIEVAAGLSGRGWRFAGRFGDRLTYIETDLPEMVELKQRALREAGSIGPHHRVVVLDALRPDGDRSLASVAEGLDPARGLAIITEGLLSYLDRDSVLDLWRRSAEVLSSFDNGKMLADLHLADENRGAAVAVFVRLLSVFVRGRVRMHFDDEVKARKALIDAGFAEATLRRGSEVRESRGASSVRVAEATV